ncbi:hypothetical protein JYB88_09595 [Shewanella cyperi]|uniref:Uncharacterized protein n=1 Tax=Shewanella cyperi TaxID=2814292 RepID=A0A974XJU0_9GAMM|nr:hypothetical protein [Shewanella cyperi]QSX28558.1 hypothetical protein JYB88_09595 [Shewanella cyperi]
MIDRGARNKVAEVTRHYLTGLATNFEFDDALFSLESHDPVIKAIRDQLWLLYDDLCEHKHEGVWAISVEQHEIVMRIMMFLKTDFEYQWPRVPSWYSASRPFIRLLTLGFGSRMLDRKFAFKDHENVWPFHNPEQLAQAKNNPT